MSELCIGQSTKKPGKLPGFSSSALLFDVLIWFSLKQLLANFRTKMIFLALIDPPKWQLGCIYLHSTNRINSKWIALFVVGLHIESAHYFSFLL
jgi:hypothetical protein